MTYDRTDRFRRAAILVASLDDALAEQVLAGLPPAERDRVLDEAERFKSIDPDEQRDVLTEFRRLTRGGRREDAVEAAFSLPGSKEASSGGRGVDSFLAAAESADAVNTVSASGLIAGDAAAMAELLQAEHPQIVAAALARLGEEQSAAVFAALPAEVQAEALARLADLAPADEAALDDVASQLERRLNERRERQARAAAGAELVQKILARTPAAQRSFLLARMAAKDAASPNSAGPQATATVRTGVAAKTAAARLDAVAEQALHLASAMRRSESASAYESAAFEEPALEDRSAGFELLSDEALVAALRSADETTVLRALAASGGGLLARVAGMLPRRQAKQLKRMLGKLGPTRLVDLHDAQHRLLELARGSVTEEAAA